MSLYDIPIAPRGGHFIPGSPIPVAVNKGYGWIFTGRERATGRERKYWAKTSFGNKHDLDAFISHHFPGIEFIDGGPADKEPAIVYAMPPHSFQSGVFEEAYRITHGDHRTRSTMRTLPRVRFSSRR